MAGTLMFILLVVATVLVNVGQKIFMKILGANMMFFSVKGRITTILLVWFVLCRLCGVM